tara:strand:- start:363 stop:1052 length:690 start_codon:yes stop_codon:yes gene_type:complete
MFNFLSLLVFIFFSVISNATAQDTDVPASSDAATEDFGIPVWELPDLEPAVIFVAISEVTMSSGKGTSEELNVLIEHYGSQVGNLEYQLAKSTKHQKRRIDVYNRDNVRFFNDKCDYINKPLDCGVENGHWTIRTFVQVGEKYSSIIVRLYDEKGRIIAQGKKTAWGTIRLLPQWKLTTIKESGGFGGDKSTEIFEQYPPKIQELPPLITPYHIHQATLGMFLSVKIKE